MNATKTTQAHDSKKQAHLLICSFAQWKNQKDWGFENRIEDWKMNVHDKQRELAKLKEELQVLKSQKPRKADKSIEAYNENMEHQLEYAKERNLVAKVYPNWIDPLKLTEEEMDNLPDAKVISKEGN